jgi:hypothetical protein
VFLPGNKVIRGLQLASKVETEIPTLLGRYRRERRFYTKTKSKTKNSTNKRPPKFAKPGDSFTINGISMKPFSGNLTQSNLKLTLMLVAIPFAALTVGLVWIVQDSPSTTFKNYQQALSTSDWKATLAISDQNTFDYLNSLQQWIVTDSSEELSGLDGFEQFLVLRACFETRKTELERLDEVELFGIWMKALEIRPQLLKTKVMNQYYFGDTAIGQLFSTKTHSNTGMKFRLVHESGWKVDTISLMREYYEASGCIGNYEQSPEIGIGNPDKGYLSRHPQGIKANLAEWHTL